MIWRILTIFLLFLRLYMKSKVETSSFNSDKERNVLETYNNIIIVSYNRATHHISYISLKISLFYFDIR